MTTTELNAVRDLRDELALERRRLEDLRACAGSMSRVFDGLPKAKATTSAVEKIAIAIVESERHIEELTEAIALSSAELVTAISATITKPLMMSAMIRRYVTCKTTAAIAMRLHITREYVWKLCKRGVNHDIGTSRYWEYPCRLRGRLDLQCAG